MSFFMPAKWESYWKMVPEGVASVSGIFRKANRPIKYCLIAKLAISANNQAFFSKFLHIVREMCR